jgi:secondary thiamine-phosphate synthase enzyme
MWNRAASGHKLEKVMADLKIRTESRAALLDITEQVNHAVAESGVHNGLCNLFVLHTTAGVIVSENWDPDVTRDMLMQLERMVPREGGYRHGEGNSQAHILSVMVSTSINIPIRDGRLALGRWQGVMFAEFDGPRDRQLQMTVIEEAKGAERR